MIDRMGYLMFYMKVLCVSGELDVARGEGQRSVTLPGSIRWFEAQPTLSDRSLPFQ